MNYLSTEEILYIHNRIVEEFDGKHGVVEPRTLKKAIKYIRNNEVFPDLESKTAALLFAIGKKKPFLSLNKKTAIAATYLFLENNKKTWDIESEIVTNFFKNQFDNAKLEEIKTLVGNSTK